MACADWNNVKKSGVHINFTRQMWMALDLVMDFIDTCITNIYCGMLVIHQILGLATVGAIQMRGGRSLNLIHFQHLVLNSIPVVLEIRMVHTVWRVMTTLGIIKEPWRGQDESWVEHGARLLVLFERKPTIQLDQGICE